MCLRNVYRGSEKKEALAKLPKLGYYWKTVSKHNNGRYYPICFSLPYHKPFKSGWNQTKRNYIGEGYNVAFHLHKTRRATRTWRGIAIRCKVYKKDIVAIGSQFGELTIVTKRIWIPKPS